eukprot:TRINITY_DN11131_c0_g1_i6.p1 TRINITY_DN11131_c0_g1~~TRINITY_DN11131_c0_g1_i6.p1  ORF type:complete len:638 (+),score=78.72 TRINITY_DN11131_c0_g1_i6:159-2072(+)
MEYQDQEGARIFGLFVIKWSDQNHLGTSVISRGLEHSLADVIGLPCAAIDTIEAKGALETLRYVITLSGGQMGNSVTEQARAVIERLNLENETSMMMRVAKVCPDLLQFHDDTSCNQGAWTFEWMSPPEVSYAASVRKEDDGCEQQADYVLLKGVRKQISINDVFMNSSSLKIDNWRSNVSRELHSLQEEIHAAIPTCYGAKRYTLNDLRFKVAGRCWNADAADSDKCWFGLGDANLCGDWESWKYCQPWNCTLTCEFEVEKIQFELCGQSGSHIAGILHHAANRLQYVDVNWDVWTPPEVTACTCHYFVEVHTGEHFFGALNCPHHVTGHYKYYTLNSYLQRKLLEKGLAWSFHEKRNESGSFDSFRVRALEDALGNATEAWVNFSELVTNWKYNDYAEWYVKDKVKLHISWHVKVTLSHASSLPWLAPGGIDLPCLVELQEQRVVVDFEGSSSKHHPLRGYQYGYEGIHEMSSRGRYGAYTGDSSSYSWGYHGSHAFINLYAGGFSTALWSHANGASYEMTPEDVAAWRLRYNLSHWDQPSQNILRKIRAGPTNGSLTLTVQPPAGGPSTTWRFCFTPADGFHLYKQVCTEKFHVGATAADCEKLTQLSFAAVSRPTRFLLLWAVLVHWLIVEFP